MAMANTDNSPVLRNQDDKIFINCELLSFSNQVPASRIASRKICAGNTENIGVDVLIVGLATKLATMLVFSAIRGEDREENGPRCQSQTRSSTLILVSAAVLMLTFMEKVALSLGHEVQLRGPISVVP
ncbi:hypothetical protein E2P81_ATG08036 [Venturia nashicola]|uniref:Uncharacterized protein n=1 Tax=Venturia nashicola TaxID=86259 RepID=A0A4Z1NRP2_9PEZI|nr:hypothetical protein E6O75_ATG08210 [Venturia nashicola]TLD26224.1 hypothetical protein E2P81_ATG08036 [Venturia nashicola]